MGRAVMSRCTFLAASVRSFNNADWCIVQLRLTYGRLEVTHTGRELLFVIDKLDRSTYKLGDLLLTYQCLAYVQCNRCQGRSS